MNALKLLSTSPFVVVATLAKTTNSKMKRNTENTDIATVIYTNNDAELCVYLAKKHYNYYLGHRHLEQHEYAQP